MSDSPTPSVEMRVRSIQLRIGLATRVMSELIEDVHSPDASQLNELIQVLDDAAADLAWLGKLPYPISEYSGEGMQAWVQGCAASVLAKVTRER